MRARAGRPAPRLAWPLGLASVLLLSFLALPFLALLGALPEADRSAFTGGGTLGALATSLLAATVATGLDALLGIPLGLWLAGTGSRLRHLVTSLVVLPLAVPPVVGGLELVLLLGPNGRLGSHLARLGLDPLDTVVGTILAQMFVAAPFVVISARAAFAGVDPGMTDAARSLGSGPAAVFYRVLLPASRRGLAAGVVLGWVRCMGEFGATAVVAYHPYTLPTLTYVNLSGEGLRTALPAGALLAGVGTAAAALLLWLDGRRPRRRALLPLQAADLAASASAAGWLPAASEEPPARLEMRAAGVFGAFRLEVEFESQAPTVAILGPSGAGKSLTLRALAGLVTVDAGRIRLKGEVLLDTAAGVNVPAERRRIGYVGQRDGLFEHLDVEGNIAYAIGHLPAAERRGRTGQLLVWMGLEGVRHSRPESLSGGERQRVALARALAGGPTALLLDEPFSSVDAARRRELRSLLRTVHRRTGVPVILVTHDRDDALDLADYVVVIENGRVVQQGPLTEVTGRPDTASVAHLVGIPNLIAIASLKPARGARVQAQTEWGTLDVGRPGGWNGEWRLAVPIDAIRVASGRPNARVTQARPAVGGWRLQLEPASGGAPLETLVPSHEGPPHVAGALCRVRISAERCSLVRAD